MLNNNRQPNQQILDTKNFMKKTITLILIFCCIFANAQEKKEKGKMAYSGFSGGMLLHLGYVQSKNFTFSNGQTMQLKGLVFGLGGQARVHFGKYFRIGGEGYFSEHKYKNGSYARIGWGGVLADCAFQIGKFAPFVGGTFGGGSQQNLTNFSEPKNDYILDETSYRKYGFMCVVPFVGVEYGLSKRIHLVFKADYMFNVSNRQADFITGPRFYLGFTFCR